MAIARSSDGKGMGFDSRGNFFYDFNESIFRNKYQRKEKYTELRLQKIRSGFLLREVNSASHFFPCYTQLRNQAKY